MYSWREVYELNLTAYQTRDTDGKGGGEADGGGNDSVDTYRVAGQLRVIVWDTEAGRRRIVPMRWGFPHPKDWRRPQPIHARAETVDQVNAFRQAFHDGQRGIVIFRTFNEGKEEIEKPSGKTATKQWTIDSQDGQPRGFAFVWRRFEIKDLPVPMLACVMVTVPASELVRTKIKPKEDEPRMPAILKEMTPGLWGSANAAPRRPT